MKCFIVSRDHLGTYVDEVDTEKGIVRTDAGFLEYSTGEEDISLDEKDLIEIYFEK